MEFLAAHGAALLFYPFALLAVGGAVLVISLRTMRQRESLVDSLRRGRGDQREARAQVVEAET